MQFHMNLPLLYIYIYIYIYIYKTENAKKVISLHMKKKSTGNMFSYYIDKHI